MRIGGGSSGKSGRATGMRRLPSSRAVVGGSLCALLFVIAGCSFSESSKSSSKIISSPFESSSKSSSPGDRYHADVRDFTSGYLKSGGDPSKLEQEVATVAEKHGVTDWESDESTYTGLGEGLHKAGLSEGELEGYKRTIADTSEQAAWMQEGYDAYDPED